MSPAANTPGRFVANLPCSALAFVRAVALDAELLRAAGLRGRGSPSPAGRAGPARPSRCRGPPCGMNRPLSLTHSTRTVCSSLTWPCSSPTNRFGVDEIVARIVAEDGGGFFLAVIELVNLGPLRPRIVGGAVERRLGEDLELDQALAAVAHRGADAVGAGVAAADDDDVLVLGARCSGRPCARVEQALGVRGQELHREVDALELAALRRAGRAASSRRRTARRRRSPSAASSAG